MAITHLESFSHPVLTLFMPHLCRPCHLPSSRGQSTPLQVCIPHPFSSTPTARQPSCNIWRAQPDAWLNPANTVVDGAHTTPLPRAVSPSRFDGLHMSGGTMVLCCPTFLHHHHTRLRLVQHLSKFTNATHDSQPNPTPIEAHPRLKPAFHIPGPCTRPRHARKGSLQPFHRRRPPRRHHRPRLPPQRHRAGNRFRTHTGLSATGPATTPRPRRTDAHPFVVGDNDGHAPRSSGRGPAGPERRRHERRHSDAPATKSLGRPQGPQGELADALFRHP